MADISRAGAHRQIHRERVLLWEETQLIGEGGRFAFVADIRHRYQLVTNDHFGEDNTFKS